MRQAQESAERAEKRARWTLGGAAALILATFAILFSLFSIIFDDLRALADRQLKQSTDLESVRVNLKDKVDSSDAPNDLEERMSRLEQALAHRDPNLGGAR